MKPICCMTARSLVELMQIAYSIGGAWEKRWSPSPMRFWFRGHYDEAYDLNPGLLRGKQSPEECRELEFQLAVDFKLRGRPHFKEEYNAWDAMFLMQHYGFHTRLLDWSESLVVAAYFACRDIDSDKNGAVWMLAPQRLIQIQHGGNSTHLYSGHDYVNHYRLCGPWDNLNEFNTQLPMPILPNHLDSRIVVQRGRFTVHTFQKDALFNLKSEDDREYGVASFLQKIWIPNSAKSTIRQQCLMFGGVSEDTIYPDLEGLSRSVKFELKERGVLP